ncbi:MAG: sulfurtransferase [Sterolibacterium sp.]|jgi:rhodanese-related sulfurtransferase|nr:sulfurtransferase [Sterolibacterium sp.]
MRQISAPQLAAWLADTQRPRPVLVDVREPWEFALCHIDGAMAMPINSIPSRCGELDADAETVLICHHGQRSQQIALFLERQGFTQVTNLAGGVADWARQVEPAMPSY